MVAATDLKTEVEKAVMDKITAGEAFTTVDISHPIINQDKSIRHKQVRTIIDEMLAQGVFDNHKYAVSPITVYPKQNKPISGVRLFHPDDPIFNPNSYTATNQELSRDSNKSSITRGFQIPDADGDDGSSDNMIVVGATPSGNAVTKQCQIQQCRGTLNIPAILVKSAGFSSGDYINVVTSASMITIEKSQVQTNQQIDADGRLRIYGKNVESLNKQNGDTCMAMLVENPNKEKVIQIQ